MVRGKIEKSKSTTFIDVIGKRVHVTTERKVVNQFESMARSKENQLKKIMK